MCFVHFDLEMCFANLRDTTGSTFSTSQLPKVIRDRQFFNTFDFEKASRHNGVHFFGITTSKSAPILVCFVHVDEEMCLAAKRNALFRHHNFQKCSDPGVLCTCWRGNVPRGKTECTVSTASTSQLAKVLREWCDLYILSLLRATMACNFSSLIWPDGSAPAALASLLFDPPEPQIIGKTQCFATFLPFRAPGSSFFWDFLFLILFLLLFSSLLVSSLLFSAFSSLLFFDSYHLCFSSVHTVGSLTSKLPSMNGVSTGI